MPIQKGDSRAGLGDLVPADHEILGFNDLGDPLAVAPDGRVIEFAHDLGSKSVAFRTREQFEAFVAFQHELTVPEGADLTTLRAKKERLAEFAKAMTGCPFAKQEIAATKSDLADAIRDLRFAESPQGKSLAKRKAFGAQCEAALRAAGYDREIMVRPDSDNEKGAIVWGDLSPPWTEARVRELLEPLARTAKLQLRFVPRAKT